MSGRRPTLEEVKKAERTLCITDATRSERGVAVAYRFLGSKAHSDSRQVDKTRGLDFNAINEARDTLVAAYEHNVGGWKAVWNNAKQARDEYEKRKWKEITGKPSPTEKKNQGNQKKDDKKPKTTDSTKSRTSSNVGSKRNSQLVVRTKANGKNSMPTNSKSTNTGKELALIKGTEEKSERHKSDQVGPELDSPLKTDPEEENRARLKKIMDEYDASARANLKSQIKAQYERMYSETSTGVPPESSSEESDVSIDHSSSTQSNTIPIPRQSNTIPTPRQSKQGSAASASGDNNLRTRWIEHYAKPEFYDRTKCPTGPISTAQNPALTKDQVRELPGVDPKLLDKIYRCSR